MDIIISLALDSTGPSNLANLTFHLGPNTYEPSNALYFSSPNSCQINEEDGYELSSNA